MLQTALPGPASPAVHLAALPLLIQAASAMHVLNAYVQYLTAKFSATVPWCALGHPRCPADPAYGTSFAHDAVMSKGDI
jgi:hypothetical protein